MTCFGKFLDSTNFLGNALNIFLSIIENATLAGHLGWKNVLGIMAVHHHLVYIRQAFGQGRVGVTSNVLLTLILRMFSNLLLEDVQLKSTQTSTNN